MPLLTVLRVLRAAAVALTLSVSVLARAETLEAPVGGKPISLGHGRIACDKPAGGWSIVGTGLAVEPPDGEQALGQAVNLRVATERAACATTNESVTLVAIG